MTGSPESASEPPRAFVAEPARNPLARTLRAYAADARAAFTAAPVEVALGVVLAVSLSMQARGRFQDEDDFFRVAACVVLAFPLVFSLSVLRARGVISAAARWAGTAAIVAACAAFGVWALHAEHAADWWRWALLASAAVLLLVMTPALPWRERDRRREWAFAWRLVVRIVGIALYSAALYALLAGAVAAIVSLFDLNQPEHLYADLAGIVFFACAPWILVGGIHRLSAPVEDGVPVIASVLGRWLYAPVLVIYLLILYAYAARVLATGELPRNLVSPLVIAAGVIGLFGAVLLEPVHEDGEHRGLSMLVRAVPALLLPLVPLALWAVLARLGEYGWTEFRYARLAVVVAIGALAVLGTMRLIRRRPPLLSVVPAVFAAVLLLSSIGPWSAPAVSRRDQTARLRGAFHQARVDPRALPRDTVRVDSALYQRIDSGARYLLEAHGIAALREVVPGAADSLRARWRMAELLGVRGDGCLGRRSLFAEVSWEGGVPGVMGGTVQEVRLHPRDSAVVTMEGARLRLRLDADRVRVDADGWSASADLSPLLRTFAAQAGECTPLREHRGASYPARDALLPVREASGVVRGQLLVTHVAAGAEPGAPDLSPLGASSLNGLFILSR